jgi:hypothetical protein
MVAFATQAKKTGSIVFYQTDVTEAEDFVYFRKSLSIMLVSRIVFAVDSDVAASFFCIFSSSL